MGCRGGTCPLPSSCRVVVLCASEDLLPDCSGVHVNVRAMVVFEDASGNPTCCIILNNIEFDCTSFVRFPSGTTVTGSALRNELKIIDGSCVVVNLTCTLSSDRRTATVSGTIVEKLWKEENLWVEGILPYPHSITVKENFQHHMLFQNAIIKIVKRIVDDIAHNPFYRNRINSYLLFIVVFKFFINVLIDKEVSLFDTIISVKVSSIVQIV